MTSFNANVVVLGSALAVFAGGPAGAAGQAAQGAAAASTVLQADEREAIPGAENMSSAERDAYRRRMADAATPDEKARIRAEYAKSQSAAAPPAKLVGDPARGAKLHPVCFSCHGVEQYVAPVTYAAAGFIDSVLRASGLSDLPPPESARFKGKTKSLSDLRDRVMRRNEYLNPKMTPQEVEDLVAYLNATYYKFPQ
jgi:cytochrome c1